MGLSTSRYQPAEMARWTKLLAPIKNEYAAELEAKKLPGKKVLDALNKMAEKK